MKAVVSYDSSGLDADYGLAHGLVDDQASQLS